MTALLRILVVGITLTLAALPARAEPFDDALAALGSPGFEEIRHGVEQLAISGNPRAAAIIEALQSGKLLVRTDHALFIRDADGALHVASTGEPAGDVMASALKPVRLNNGVRRAIEAALGSLGLFDADPSARAKAAEEVFKSRDPATLPALEKAIAKEADGHVKRLLEQADAATLLSQPAPAAAPDAKGPNTAEVAQRLAAVAALRDRGDLDARALLTGLTDQPQAVNEAAADAVGAIDRMQRIWSLVQSAYFGLSLGSVLLLAAAGLAITFGVMGVINMAHGEMVMLGAYTTFVVQGAIRDYVPGLMGASLLFAVPLAFLVSAGVGVLVERGLIRYLYGRPLETLLATWGLSLMLQQAVRTIFGANNREVTTPDWMSGATELGGITLTYNRLYIIIFAAIVFIALMLVLRFTTLGLEMRAVTQNRRMAAAMGIAHALGRRG